MSNRVKFYPPTDIAFGYNLGKITNIKLPTFEAVTINDAIEFYEIHRYFNNGAKRNDWTDEDFQIYKEKSKNLYRLTCRFFETICDDNIVSLYDSIEFDYHSVFWILFDNCKLYKRISKKVFELLIKCERVYSRDLFLYKNIVNKYGNELRNYILRNDFCISVILHVYGQDYTDNEHLYLPSELTNNDISRYIEKYIDSGNANINYLYAIVNMRYDNRFSVTNQLRLRAKRKFCLLEDEILRKDDTLKFRHEVYFDKGQDEIKRFIENDKQICFSYNAVYLENTLDYPSILNNFIFLFEYTDSQVRSNHLCRKDEATIIDRITASDSACLYPRNVTFESKHLIASMQMMAYTELLIDKGIYLEDVLKWFFTEYLQKEFGCPEIRVLMPSHNCTYHEKCIIIITAFETVLKQYSIYVDYSAIDFELIEMLSTPMKFEEVKSQIKGKYVYGNGDVYLNLSYALFSDQCMLHCIEKFYNDGKRYASFAELLINEQIYLSDYNGRSQDLKMIEYLKEQGYVEIRDGSQICIKNVERLILLNDLYKHEVINRNYYPHSFQVVIDDLIGEGLLENGSTLFSRQEIKYLNYLLNKAEYVNGLELRNKYMHGTQHIEVNDEKHKQNYLILLRLFVLLVIKVNDEFSLKARIDGDTQNYLEFK